MRGNSGRGIVKAKRSKSSERNTTLSTLISMVNLVDVMTVDQRSGSGDLSAKFRRVCTMRNEEKAVVTQW